MKLFKLNTLLVGLLLANTYVPINSMLTRKQIVREGIKNFYKRVGDVLNGKESAATLTTLHDFPNLPPDLQTNILTLATLNANATTLGTSIKTIQSLALVNTSLNEFINDPIFTEELILHLSQKFNTSPEQVASLLATKGAQDYLKQRLFYPKNSLDLDGKDIKINITNENGNTPLMQAVENLDLHTITMILSNPKARLKTQNKQGNTALHLALQAMDNADNVSDYRLVRTIITLLINASVKKRKNPFMNTQNNDGNTPLHLLLYIMNNTSDTAKTKYLSNILKTFAHYNFHNNLLIENTHQIIPRDLLRTLADRRLANDIELEIASHF